VKLTRGRLGGLSGSDCLAARQPDEQAKRLVDRRRVGEGVDQVWLEKHYVRARLIGLVVHPALALEKSYSGRILSMLAVGVSGS